MGEVYRARGSRLELEVALKVLPPSFAADAERWRRVEQVFDRNSSPAAALRLEAGLTLFCDGTTIEQ